MDNLELKGIELFLSKIFNSKLVAKIEEFNKRNQKLKETTQGRNAAQLREKIADLDIKASQQTINDALYIAYKSKAESSLRNKLKEELEEIQKNETNEIQEIKILIYEARDTFWKWFVGTVLFGIIVGLTIDYLVNSATKPIEKPQTKVSYNINYTKLLDGRAVKP